MERKRFLWKERLASFAYAWAGIRQAFKTEHNTWIHLFLTITSVIAGLILQIEKWDWIALVIVITMVWVAELFNTCIEKIMDFISTEKHPQIKLVKDVAAAAVLITAFSAIIVGLLIFVPKLF